MSTEAYFKKEILLRHAGHLLRLRVSQDLFSSYEVDTGTQRLLRSFRDVETAPFCRVLDMGCGYGPLGLAFKAQDPQRAVHLVDRDALAVEYARQNALLNGLAGVECYGSLGYDDIAADFDLVLMNVPAKAGPPVIAYLLQEAAHQLRPGGLVAIVVVSALEPLAAEILARPGIEVHRRQAWPGHTVWHYSFSQAPARPAGSALERGVYDGGELIVSWRGEPLALRTAYGLPDREAMSPATAMLLEGIGKLPEGPVRRALVLNPGQGHTPAALWQRCRPAEIVLADRDLLALRASRMNLLRNGCPEERVWLRHQAGPLPSAPPADLIVGVLREEEGPEAVAATVSRAAELLAPGGSMLLAASSTAATRVVGLLESTRRLAVKRRTRSRGRSLLLLQHRTGPPRTP